MDKKKVGEFLTARKKQLELSSIQIAERIGCSRTTVERTEKGISCIRRRNIITYAAAYEVDADELAELCGYPAESIAVAKTIEITVSVEDLEFLITVARGLQKPMTLAMVQQLLKCRKA